MILGAIIAKSIIIYAIGAFTVLVSAIVPSGKYTKWKTQLQMQLKSFDENTIEFLNQMELGMQFRKGFKLKLEREKSFETIDFSIKGPSYIEIVEISDNEVMKEPYLIVKYRESINSIFTFARRKKQIKYIFYVPSMRTINEDLKNFIY